MVNFDIFLNDLYRSIGIAMPELILTITFAVAIIADLMFKKVRSIAGWVGLVGFGATAYSMMTLSGTSAFGFSQLLVVDPFAEFFKYLFLLSGAGVILMSLFSDELWKESRSMGEYYTLILGMTIGMFLIAGAGNLIMIYLALETMSLSSYVLAGYTKEIKRASEASLKYVIYGSTASGLMIYGISLMFGLTGTLNICEMNAALAHYDGNTLALITSSLMIIAGIAYKISAVPFHFWTPDVYEGAPTTITAYLAVASKAAGFAVLIRFLKAGFIDTTAIDNGAWSLINGIDWKFVIAILSVLTMTLGNLVALWQNNVKRMLAYSGIAHAGYLLMGVAVMTTVGNYSIMLYFVMYLITIYGAFFVTNLIANKINSEDMDDWAGFGFRSPLLGTAMTVFMISLTGLPPTAGFIGKFYLFGAVLDAGWIWLAVVGVLNSVISLFYYMKVMRTMWLRGADNHGEEVTYSMGAQVMVYVFMVPTVILGIWYGPILRWVEQSAVIFLGK